MTGLVDRPHSTFAHAVEEDVGAEDQFHGVARERGAGLELGETGFDEGADPTVWREFVGLDRFRDAARGLVRKQFQPPKFGEKRIGCLCWHPGRLAVTFLQYGNT